MSGDRLEEEGMSGRSCCYSKEVKSELEVGIDREGMEVRRRRRTWWESGEG